MSRATDTGEDGATKGDGMPIVDAHQHFWDLDRNYYPWLCDPKLIPFRYGDYSVLKRTYLPPDYLQHVGANRIVKTVHMEAEWDRGDPVAETRWIEGIAAKYDFPSACIGHAEPDREDIEDVLRGHAASPLVRGIRHKPAASGRPQDARRGTSGSMDDPKWRDGYALLERFSLSYDLQTPWWHLDAAAELAAAFPATTIIVNHTGLPSDRSEEGLAGWRHALETVAAQLNVALKISGLGRPGLPWTVEANAPVIRDAVAIFGVDRCMFASNYPVDRLAGPFTTIYDGFREAVADLPVADRRKLFHDNAVRIYRL
ncbi:amidohydrolase family protein [Microbaculum marinum]|uniref:Amidohydrolase family protein n=1 Tax=Microbaculum marinum TaxID=1764581 RepID=A0AAW9S4B1_9HYPH